MKNERLFEALEKIDEELIDEAAPGNKPPKKKTKTFVICKIFDENENLTFE